MNALCLWTTTTTFVPIAFSSDISSHKNQLSASRNSDGSHAQIDSMLEDHVSSTQGPDLLRLADIKNVPYTTTLSMTQHLPHHKIQTLATTYLSSCHQPHRPCGSSRLRCCFVLFSFSTGEMGTMENPMPLFRCFLGVHKGSYENSQG